MHLNPMTSLLDPELHTAAFCRSRSAILFTAILTVSAKVCLPVLHGPALKHAKALLGQAFEAGTNNLELVQALATLVFWQDPTDDSGARKLAYAVRCAFELGIHKRGPRPLPQGEVERRHFLNPERTWICACPPRSRVQDYPDLAMPRRPHHRRPPLLDAARPS